MKVISQEDLQKKKNYYHDINFVRAIAALAVVMVHVTAAHYTLNDDYFNWLILFLNQITRFATPMFAVISGFLVYNQVIKGSFQWKRFINSRFTKIVIPFIIWSVIYLLIDGTDFFAIDDKKQFMYDFIFGKSYQHLYFIAIIIQFYILFPLLQYFISTKQLLFLTILAFNITFFYLFLSPPDFSEGFLNEFMHERANIFKWIFYFLFGGLISLYWEKVSLFVQNNKKLVMCIGSVPLIFIVYEYLVANDILTSDRVANTLHVPILFIALTSLYHMLEKLKWLRTMVIKLGDLSMGIYLVHPLVIYFIQEEFSWIFEQTRWILFGYVLTMILCVILVKVIHKLPFGNYVVIIAKKK